MIVNYFFAGRFLIIGFCDVVAGGEPHRQSEGGDFDAKLGIVVTFLHFVVLVVVLVELLMTVLVKGCRRTDF